MPGRTETPRYAVVLKGYDQAETLVEDTVLSTDLYYDGENPLIDDSA